MVEKKLTVTIGIPALNEEANIKYLLESILSQRQENYIITKIIVNSDGSTDKTVELAKSINNPLIEVIDNNERKGQYFRQNEIVQKFDDDILVLLNADILPANVNFLEHITAPFQIDTKIGIVSPMACFSYPETTIEDVLNLRLKIYNDVFGKYKNGNNIYMCRGMARAFCNELAKKIEWPQAVGEDSYSYLYCITNGYKFKYQPSAQFTFKSPKTLVEHEKQSSRYFSSVGVKKDYFDNELVASEYALPLNIIIPTMLKYLVLQPTYIFLYALLYFNGIIKSYTKRYQSKAVLWDLAKSSKELISNNNKTSICYFGAYDKSYSRNKIIIEGLIKNNIKVLECNVDKVQFSSTSKYSFYKYIALLPFSFIYRYFKLITIGNNLLSKETCKVIFVGYPGHMDVLAGYILKKITGAKLIFDPLISIYDTFVDDRKMIKNKILAKLVKQYENIVMNLPDLVIADTHGHKEYYINNYNIPESKVKVLYIGAEDRIYYPSDNIVTNEKTTVIFYGYHSPLHGIEHIINAAKIVENKDSSIEFLIIGDGQLYKENLELAKNLGLKNIKFIPSMPEVEVTPYLQKADIFLGVFQNSPKSKRVVPNKVFQGIALKKAVITADTQGIREVFNNNENVMLCKTADPHSLAECILQLKKLDLRTTIATNGYKLYKEKFTPRIVADSLINIFKSEKVFA